MGEGMRISDTPLMNAIEEARREFHREGYEVELTGVEKCYLAGYEDTDTPMTDVGVIKCLNNEKRTYRVFTRVIKKAVGNFDPTKPVWVIIFRLPMGLEMVADILEHTDQLEQLYQQMRRRLKE